MAMTTGSVRLGLLGQGIGASRTPAMHRAEGAAQGLDLAYELIDTDGMDAPDPAALLDRIEGEGFAGINVTYPFKKAVMPHLDELSASATRVGAVNTVVFRDGRRYGHNTDLWGFAEGLRDGLPGAKMDRVLLLGAGGAGGAVARALLDAGAGRLEITDIDPSSAAALVAALEAEAPGRVALAGEMARTAAEADGIVNATPMGMAKLPGTAIDVNLLEPRHWVADIVYFPLETALLREARARGCATLEGSGMAVFQAVRAFHLFTGQAADPARMRATFRAFDDANG